MTVHRIVYLTCASSIEQYGQLEATCKAKSNAIAEFHDAHDANLFSTIAPIDSLRQRKSGSPEVCQAHSMISIGF